MKNSNIIIKICVALSISCAILSSCESSRQQFNMHELANSQFDLNKYIDPKSIINIPLEKSENFKIFRIELVRVTKDYIFVVNNVSPAKTLLMFGRDGRFIRQISNVGYGLNEYIEFVDFDINEKQQRVYIDAANKILEFGFSGNYISSVKVPDEWGNGGGFRSLGASKFLIARGDNRGLNESQNHRVVVTNNDGQILSKYIPRPELYSSKRSIMPKSSGFFANSDVTEYYYFPMGSDSLYMINEKGDNKFIREFGMQNYIMQPNFSWEQYRQFVTSMLHPLSHLCLNNKGVFSFVANYNQTPYTFVGTLKGGIKWFGRNTPSANWPGQVINYATYREYFVTVKSAAEAFNYPDLFPEITADDNPIIVLYKYKRTSIN